LISLLLVIGITLVEGMVYLKLKLGSYKLLVYSFFIAVLTGVSLDLVLGNTVGWWNYNHHPILTVSYWSIIPIAWGVFGCWVHVTWKITKLLLPIRYEYGIVPFMFVVTSIAIVSEILGFTRNIWTYYNAPAWLIVIGWVILILHLVVTTEVLDAVYNKVSKRTVA